MVNQRFLSRLAFVASIFALGVIALGASTRLLDAGLGCPDWPGCYGHMVAPLSGISEKNIVKAWAEMIHRYFVGGLSVLILILIVMIFSQKKLRTCFNSAMAVFLILLLGYQIMLGQWTVTLKLWPVIVSQHLLGGYLVLSALWLLYLKNAAPVSAAKNKPVSLTLLFSALVGLLLVLLQILLGVWTSTHYASLSCPDFPFCINDKAMIWHWKAAFTVFSPVGLNYEGGILTDVIRQTIQMTHRLGALIVAVYLVLFFAMASTILKNRPDLLKILYWVMGLLCIQICLGISNVIFKLPLVTALCHTLVAVLLFVSLVTFIFRLLETSGGAAPWSQR